MLSLVFCLIGAQSRLMDSKDEDDQVWKKPKNSLTMKNRCSGTRDCKNCQQACILNGTCVDCQEFSITVDHNTLIYYCGACRMNCIKCSKWDTSVNKWNNIFVCFNCLP